MNTHQAIIKAAGTALVVGLGVITAPTAHADAMNTIAQDYIKQVEASSSWRLQIPQQRELAMDMGVLACRIDAQGAPVPVDSRNILAAAQSSGWCDLAAADGTDITSLATTLSQTTESTSAPIVAAGGPADAQTGAADQITQDQLIAANSKLQESHDDTINNIIDSMGPHHDDDE